MEQGRRREKLPPGLYALCDDGLRPEASLAQKARWLLAGGARVVQLRMKRTGDRAALAAAREVAALCRERGAVSVVNDRVDLALLSGAEGVHLGDDDLPPAEARRLLGPERLIGVTVRGLADIEAAWRAGADYVGLGPLFPTSTKQVNAPPLGLERFAKLVAHSPLPVVGIAGIGLANIEDVARAGAHGAAVGSDLLVGDEVAERARLLSEAFERGAKRARVE